MCIHRLLSDGRGFRIESHDRPFQQSALKRYVLCRDPGDFQARRKY